MIGAAKDSKEYDGSRMVVKSDMLGNMESSEGIRRFMLGSMEASKMKGIGPESIMLRLGTFSGLRATYELRIGCKLYGRRRWLR